MFFDWCKVFRFGTSKILRLNFLISALPYENCESLAVLGCFQNIFSLFSFIPYGQQKFCLSQQHAVDLPLIEIQLQYHFMRNATLDVLEKMKSRDIRNISRDIYLSSVTLKCIFILELILNETQQNYLFIYFYSENYEKIKDILMKCFTSFEANLFRIIIFRKNN